ncbi:MAG TPA: YggT family protein [Aestuariivirgaceae bacterium]|nr:YggT family protein [Aestuariivirgaceae bacterium]
MNEQTIPLLPFWYFHLPNYVLAALMYTLIGRFLLDMIAPAGSNNYIMRAFVTVTDPVVMVVRFITPHAVALPLVLVFGALWLMLLRVGLFLAMVRYGLGPVTGQSG